VKKDVIGFGALNLDLIYKVEDEELIKQFQTGESFISEEKFNNLKKILAERGKLEIKSGGGSAANTVYALARMGFQTGYIGKLGKDEEGEFLLQSLNPVDTSRVVFGERSGTCIILVHRGDRLILVLPNSNNTLTYDEIDLHYAQETKFLHLTSFVGDLPFEAQKKLVKEMPSGAYRLSFDPGRCYAKKGLKSLLPIIEKSYIMFVNEDEVKLLTGKDYKEGSHELLTYGPRIIACKRAKKGSYVATKDEEYLIPADETVKVVDPTGAGDVYAAGFLAGLLLDLSVGKCASLANTLAEISITGYGREKYPNKAILEETITAIKA